MAMAITHRCEQRWEVVGDKSSAKMFPQNINNKPSGKLTYLWKTTISNGQIHYKWPCSMAILTSPEGIYRTAKTPLINWVRAVHRSPMNWAATP